MKDNAHRIPQRQTYLPDRISGEPDGTQLSYLRKRSGYYFPGRPPVYQTLDRQSREGELHVLSYSSQFPIHRQ